MRRDLSRGFAINLYYSSPLPSLGEVHPHPVFAGRRLVYNSVGLDRFNAKRIILTHLGEEVLKQQQKVNVEMACDGLSILL
jgi:hypothetical protein